ncbi:hypothetical protein Lesp01_69090 [Lentzea sp. NBRC 102530]|nr:hypothetical protein Lesp01_69090 [Lentzea sp. NBRC 102530]
MPSVGADTFSCRSTGLPGISSTTGLTVKTVMGVPLGYALRLKRSDVPERYGALFRFVNRPGSSTRHRASEPTPCAASRPCSPRRARLALHFGLVLRGVADVGRSLVDFPVTTHELAGAPRSGGSGLQ